jgi:hypothetical protein
MSLFQFGSGAIAVVQSVMRAIIMTDEQRRVYATELIDTYNGFGATYLEAAIKASIKSNVISENMVKLKTPFPLLQTFIDAISAVYNQQPSRTFTLDGKILVDEITEDMDSEKYVANKDLKKILDNIYDREFCLRIKESEIYANLLSTVIYKINNREGKKKLEFVPSDVVVVAENQEDTTQMNQIYFMRGIGSNQQQALNPIYELWTLDKFEILIGSQREEKTNRAVEELRKYKGSVPGEDGAAEIISHIGSGFPPFVVLRSCLPLDGFWNLRDKDTNDVIKQICIALTEIRYLQRYGAFGLKYSVNAKLPEEAKMDITGWFEFIQDDNNLPGTPAKQVEIGELENKAKIAELTQSVMDMLRLLFTLKGINSDALTGSKERATAESKKIDRKDLIKQITYQEEIWKLNEENIFMTAICVHNRDNSKKLPAGLGITIDYADSEETAADMEKKLANFLVMIENDLKTPIDWIMEQNPDLNEEEANLLYERNTEFNKGDIEQIVPLGPDGKPLLPQNKGKQQIAEPEEMETIQQKKGMMPNG